VSPLAPRRRHASLRQARDEWLRRIESSRRSDSTLVAYRVALDDLIAWSDRQTERFDSFAERAIVSYLADYRRQARPAPATYYRRFIVLRRFFRWLSGHEGVPNPFEDLEAPRKPQQVADWLTPAEFSRLLEAAGEPPRRYHGLAERDRLVLLALALTGVRRSELIALDWGDIDLDAPSPSLIIRCGKGGRSRRQPIAPALVHELRELRTATNPSPESPVFRGLRGGRLQPTVLAAIISRATERAEIKKHVTAHTLRHTAATWLRQATGDARLVAEYLGHADLSTVHRYAHVAPAELDAAASAIAGRAGLPASAGAARVPPAARSDAGEPKSDGRAPEPSDSVEIAEGRLF
jgi:site-specific recombinase XerD